MQHLLNKIHHADCLEFMKGLPDKCIDLVLTDPPYGIGMDGNTGKSKSYERKDWDSSTPEIEYFQEIVRVSKAQIIWGVNYFDGVGLKGGAIVWNKLGYDIQRRKQAPTLSDCEIAYYSNSKNVKMFSYACMGNVVGNDYQVNWGATERIHPTQKPTELFKWCLQYAKLEKGIVLDCFSGSGTTALACHDLGLDFICIEKDLDYYNASVKRLEQHQRQLKLI